MMKNKILNIISLTIYSFIFSIQIIESQGIVPEPPIIQPGAPGEPSKILDARAATDIADTWLRFAF